MARRKVGWKDTSIRSGFGGPNRERRYRGVKGEKHYIRIMTECEEYNVHAVNDVLEPNDDGTERVFNIVCSKQWDDDAEEYVGSCLACERDYDISTRYICGIVLLGVKKGTKGKVQLIDPENSPHYWDFGADKYRKLSNHAIELAEADPPKSLTSVEFAVTCEDNNFQKLDIAVSQGKRMTTKEHVSEWKEQGDELIEGAAGPLPEKEQRRALKKRKQKDAPKKKRKHVEPEEDDDESVDIDSSGDDDIDDLLSEL